MMQKLALLCVMMATLGCSGQKASKSSEENSSTLDRWCQRIYQNVPGRRESLRCETEHFLFSIGADQDWVALFFKDKRSHSNVGTSSLAFFMSGGERLSPMVGDAGDARPGVKLLKSSQSFDAMLFEYQIGNGAVERFIFPYVNGAWAVPSQGAHP